MNCSKDIDYIKACGDRVAGIVWDVSGGDRFAESLIMCMLVLNVVLRAVFGDYYHRGRPEGVYMMSFGKCGQ